MLVLSQHVREAEEPQLPPQGLYKDHCYCLIWTPDHELLLKKRENRKKMSAEFETGETGGKNNLKNEIVEL